MKQQEPSFYKGFTISMALVDTIPVILFAIGAALVFFRVKSPLFGIGALLSVIAGSCKVSWKLILALGRRDAALLPRLFRVLMPIGFALMLLSIPFSFKAWGLLISALTVMPPLLPLVVGCIGMALMALFAVKLDGGDARVNWLEQLTNIAAQGAFVLALLLA